MRLFVNLALALSLAISFITPSLAHQARRHFAHRQADLARRDPGKITLYKRFDNARFTFYAVGLGACGKVNIPTDPIVALNTAQFGGGQYCFQTITITANGKSMQAQIMDSCPGCPFAGLDLSEGLFQSFTDLSAGVLSGSWVFGSGEPAPAPAPPPPATSAPPATTSHPAPTTTSEPSSTTPSSSDSSSTNTSSSSSSSSPTQTTTNAPSVTAVPAATIDSSILSLYYSLVSVGSFLTACNGL